MKEIFIAVKAFFIDRFNLNEDKAEEEEIVSNIRRDVTFKGTNLWTLIFAILIASIGLNVNSTAVIIGAMLISPLMGPIMGIGLGIGINDFDLVKTGLKNLAIAAVMSIITSSLYFSITPLHDANSELLARTNPSIWDVFIAFLGGLAGIVAGTRSQKSNVIPGVAIATALMPPLCTAGFGLASGSMIYFLGALYLFFINSVLICIATFIIVRHLNFRKKQFTTPQVQKRVMRYIWITVTVTTVPSIYMAYRIVQRSIFESSANRYVHNEFSFTHTQVINKTFVMGNPNVIDLLLVGQELDKTKIDSLEKKLPGYGLRSTKLVIHQGLNAKHDIDFAQIKASILKDVVTNMNSQQTDSISQDKTIKDDPRFKTELKLLYPSLEYYSLGNAIIQQTDTTRKDTVTLLLARFRTPLPRAERQRLMQWAKQRLQADTLKLVIE